MVRDPDVILLDRRHGTFDYYGIDGSTGNNLRVVVRHTKGEGFTVNAYLIRKMRRIEREPV